MLRILIPALAGGALAATLLPVAAHATDVTVRVAGVNARGGDMRVEVCTPTTFLKTCPYRAKAPAVAGTSEVVVRGVPPGDYAVIAHHDVNRNGTVDRNLLGVPKEGVGFSRNPMLIIKAPDFDDAKVPINGALAEVDITLKFEP